MRRLIALVSILAALFLASCQQAAVGIPAAHWDHIVLVWEENRDASEVASLPYLAALQSMGRTYARSYGVARPSQPNYIAMFAGSTLGVADNFDHDLSAANLYSRFAEAGFSMTSYAEALPVPGFRGTSSGQYVRKHNPAASFPAIPAAAVLPFSSFPSDYAALPELSFVIPDLDNDMHDGTPATADAWLQANMSAYVEWAKGHRSLFILTFDEPNAASGTDLSQPILTVFVGDGIDPGTIDRTTIDHYRVSDYLLDCFALPRLTQ